MIPTSVKFIVMAVCFTLSGHLYAQTNHALVKTATGCSAYVETALVKALQDGSSNWEWSGDCVEGLAYGVGSLRNTFKAGRDQSAYESIYSYTGKMHKGNFYGFMKFQFQSKHNNTAIPSKTYEPSWRFVFIDRWVGFNGLGLEGDESLLNNLTGGMPTKTTSSQREILGIGDSTIGDLSLQKIPCAIDPQTFPECGFGDGKLKYDVYRFNKTPLSANGTFDFNSVVRTYCPSPKDRSSCQPLIEGLVAPYIASIETFIRESMPKLADIDTAVRNASADLVKRRAAETAQKEKAAEMEAMQKAQAADKIAKELAASKAAYANFLNTAPVGQLFARADELSSQGDTTKAREVLRTLVSRFPNHPLAATAAQQMATMSAASANAANSANAGGSNNAASGGPVSNVSVQPPGAGNCWDVLAKREKEYEAMKRRTVPAGSTPPLMRVMWMTADSMKIIDTYCAGDAKAAKYRGELQTAYNESKTACEQMTAGGQCSANPH